jgi:SAM-dependent methyltransferase
MHPAVARAIVESFCEPGARVLDPFCGSGTLLVEAMAAGRRALGVDLNPLAVRLSSFKARLWTARHAQAILEQAHRVAERAQRARHGAPKGEGAWFAPHVLVELANLRGEILREPQGQVREGLELLLSSILVKLSRQESDTRRTKVEKQIARGFATRLFVGKAAELATRLAALGARTATGAEAASVMLGDARRLEGIGASVVSLVATSPPYRGALDYVAHHERRARWLGLDLARLSRDEMGARRDPRGFREDLRKALSAAARSLRPGGRAVLVTGDDGLEKLAEPAGLRFLAEATQRRPGNRREHLVLLEKPG